MNGLKHLLLGLQHRDRPVSFLNWYLAAGKEMATTVLDTGHWRSVSGPAEKSVLPSVCCHPITTGIPFSRKRRGSRNGSCGVRPCVHSRVTQRKEQLGAKFEGVTVWQAQVGGWGGGLRGGRHWGWDLASGPEHGEAQTAPGTEGGGSELQLRCGGCGGQDGKPEGPRVRWWPGLG